MQQNGAASPKSHPCPGVTPLGRGSGQATAALFKIGLGAERAGLHTRCNESPAIMRAKPVARQELPDQPVPL